MGRPSVWRVATHGVHAERPDAGDVDGDYIPEIVLEARQNVFINKAVSNDSFYIFDSLPGNNSGSSVRVYDVDNNGLSEVIISGDSQTRIYEYQVGTTEAGRTIITHLELKIFPNPFRTQTQIRYMIEANQQPQLRIYDTTGRLVKTFPLESSFMNRESGISWDGTDNHGNLLPAGVYFVQIQSSMSEQSVPVVLLR